MRTTFIVPGAQSENYSRICGNSRLSGPLFRPLSGPVIESNAPVRDGFPAVTFPIESWGRDFEKLTAIQGHPVERAYFLPHASIDKISVQPVAQDPGNFDDPLEWEIPADSSKMLPGAMVFARRYPEGEIGAGWRFWMLRPSDKMWLSLHSGASTNSGDLNEALGPFGMSAAASFLDQVHEFGWR